MSDTRKFSIGLFLGIGLGCAAMNHGIEIRGEGTGVVMLGLTLGSLTVMFFGKKGEAK